MNYKWSRGKGRLIQGSAYFKFGPIFQEKEKIYSKIKTLPEPHLKRITYPFGNDNIGEFRINFVKFEGLFNFDHLHVFDLGNLPISDTITINDNSFWEASVDFFIPKISRIVKSLNSYITVLHDFGIGKSVSNSQNLLAGSTAVLLETLF